MTEAVVRGEDGRIVCGRCLLAEAPLARMRGLLGRRSLPAEEGILIRPTSSIHMWFMRFPIDAVFLDAELRVVKVVENLKPWRMAAKRGAKAVLELAAGAAVSASVRVGERVTLS